MPNRRAPLEGIRIVDFSWVIAGPLTSKWLALHGAEVIKIESARDRGDVVRTDPGPSAGKQGNPNTGGAFSNLNPNKLSLALNMQQERARDIVRRLIKVSDVVLNNFAPGVMDKWGLTYEEMRAVNPSIIAVSMPAMGATGPRRHFRGLGSYFQAMAGLDVMIGYPHREIVDMGFAFPDATCNPAHAAVAILAALRHRNRTGEGQCIELRQFESTINFLGTAPLDYSVNRNVQMRTGSRAGYAAPHGVYRCAGDDRWCAITVLSDQEWRSFCGAIGHPDWIEDPRFSTLLARKAHEDLLDSLINEWTGDRSAEVVMDHLQAHGVPAGVVQHAGDLLEHDPQIAHRGFYVTLDHPEGGRMVHEGASFQLSKTPAEFRTPAPLLGQHNDYVLQTVLGMSEEEVDQCILDQAVM